MKSNNDSFFAEPVDAKREARFLTLEVISRLLIWMAEGASLEERGVRATVALYCIRPDLIGEATLEEIGHKAGRSRQAVHQLADSFRENRERAFINAAKTEAMNQTVRPVANGIRP